MVNSNKDSGKYRFCLQFTKAKLCWFDFRLKTANDKDTNNRPPQKCIKKGKKKPQKCISIQLLLTKVCAKLKLN